MKQRPLLARFSAGPCLFTATVLAVGACVAVGLATWTARSNAAFVAKRFRIDTDMLASQIQDRVTLYQYGLRGARGAVTAAGPNGITRENFRNYSASRDLATEFPGARGFGFIRRVPADAEADFVARAKSDGAPNFAIQRFAPHDGDRYVIQFVEPAAENQQAIGLDIASDAVRREAAEKAMATAKPALTGPITLVQATGQRTRGFLLMLPVWPPGTQTLTPDARREAPIGWTYAALAIDDVLAEINDNTRDIEFVLTDRSGGNDQSFFKSTQSGHVTVAGVHETRSIPIFGRTWEIDARPHPDFVTKFGLIAPRTVALVAAVVSLLLALVTFLVLSNRRRERLAAIERNRLAAIVEGSNDAMIGKTLDGVVVAWNRAAEKLFGYSTAEALGRQISALIIPHELLCEERNVIGRLRNGEIVPPFETQYRRADGRLLPMLVSMSSIRASDDTIVGVAAIARDISAQRSAEARIRALNADLERQVAERTAQLARTLVLQSTILKNAGYAVIATDIDGTITLFNPAAERMLGYAASDLVGRCSPAVFHDPNEVKEQADRLSAELGTIIEPSFEVFVSRTRRGLPNADEWTYIKKNGDRLPVLLNISVLRSDDARTIGFLGIAIDLTERYRHEDEMRAANAGTWSYDVGTGRVKLSAEAARQHGLGDAATEIDVETQWRPLAHPDDVPLVLRQLQAAIETKGSYTTEFRLRLPDSSLRWVTSVGRVETDQDGKVVRVIGLTLDCTARKEAEHALIEAKAQADHARSEAERANAAKTDFLAAMSHEIRTPLNAIIGFTDLMIDSKRLSADLHRYAELVRSSGSALLTVVNDILDFSRVEAGAIELKEEPFSPKALLDNTISIVRTSAVSKGLDIRFDCDPTIPKGLYGDQTRLRQVLLNLLNNAIKFTHAGI